MEKEYLQKYIEAEDNLLNVTEIIFDASEFYEHKLASLNN